MNRKISSVLIIALCIITLITANTWFVPAINRARTDSALTRNLPLDNAPPQFVLAVNLLGAFRSIAIDFLWIRSIQLQEDGKFFEMAQMAQWICQLEPNIEDIWTHQAWNMAYNISYEMPTGADRWRWIKRAIYLLRNEGLKYNTHSAKIRKEIAWIYSHKIGQYWDDQHWYYKKALAKEMSEYIQQPDDISRMASLPPLNETFADDPETIKFYRKIIDKGIKTLDDFDQLVTIKFSNKIQNDQHKLLRLYMRKHILENYYKLNLKTMQSLMDTYGPLDWRLPDSYAIYWATEGRKFCDKHATILYDRLIYLSLQSLYRRGSLYIAGSGQDMLYLTTPNTAFIKPMNNVYQSLFKKYAGRKAIANIKASYKYFLTEVTILLYTFNQQEQSKEFFSILKEQFPTLTQNKGYKQFIIDQFSQTLRAGNYDKVKNLLYSLLFQGYWNYAMGYDEQYIGYLKLTTTLWQEYTRRTKNQQRLRLPPVKTIAKQVVRNALNKGFPITLQESLKKKLQRIDEAHLHNTTPN